MYIKVDILNNKTTGMAIYLFINRNIKGAFQNIDGFFAKINQRAISRRGGKLQPCVLFYV